MGEMSKITVEVDAQTEATINAFLAEGDMRDAADVIRHAVAAFAAWREDQEWKWQEFLNADGPELEKRESRLEQVRALVAEGLASGEPIAADDAFWDDVKRRGRERVEQARLRAAE